MIHPAVQAEDPLTEGAGRRLVCHGLHGVHPRVHDIDPVKRLRFREHRRFGASVLALAVMAQQHMLQQDHAFPGNAGFLRNPVQVGDPPNQVPKQLSVPRVVGNIPGPVALQLVHLSEVMNDHS